MTGHKIPPGSWIDMEGSVPPGTKVSANSERRLCKYRSQSVVMVRGNSLDCFS